MQKMKVLIAEDDIISCRALAKNIQEWGYDVVVTKNGKEAWNILNKENQLPKSAHEKFVRMAVIDWEMPKMDGVELCQIIRNTSLPKRNNYIYIILLTGRDKQEDIIRGLSAGADDYMTKPFDFLELKVRLKNGERIIQFEDAQVKLASTDSLTSLWNRNKILEFLSEEIERGQRKGIPVGVIWADIDHFKEVNDTYSHVVGDKVLSEVSSRLKKSMRNYDKIGRYGGDEFLAVFPNCRQDHIRYIAERLRQVICEEDIKTDAGPLAITISVGGISSEHTKSISTKEIIEASDQALLTAKKQGRNRVVIADLD